MLDPTITLGVGMFTTTVLALVGLILIARARLVSTGNVHIGINEDAEKAVDVPAGGKLLGALAEKQIFVSSACGGGGTCAQCKVKIVKGGGVYCPPKRDISPRAKFVKVGVCLARSQLSKIWILN